MLNSNVFLCQLISYRVTMFLLVLLGVLGFCWVLSGHHGLAHHDTVCSRLALLTERGALLLLLLSIIVNMQMIP